MGRFLRFITVPLLLFALAGCGNDNQSSSGYSDYQNSTDTATMIVKRCSTEAGIPENEPKHQITPDEMLKLTTCLDAAKR